MSDSDIYKSREPIPQTPNDPRLRKGRRRRSSSLRPFDDHERERRSGNSGLRRFLHLSRKKENEKSFWWGFLIVVVFVLVVIGVWQFWYMEHRAHRDSPARSVAK